MACELRRRIGKILFDLGMYHDDVRKLNEDFPGVLAVGRKRTLDY